MKKEKKLKNRKQIINGVERLPLEIQMTIKCKPNLVTNGLQPIKWEPSIRKLKNLIKTKRPQQGSFYKRLNEVRFVFRTPIHVR